MWDSLVEYLHHNWLLAISTPIYAVLIVLEVILSNYQKRRYYTVADTLINFWLNIINTLIGIAFKATALLVLDSLFPYHFISLHNPVLYWIVLFFALDLCFYIEHRCEHYSRILWAVHVTHHSSEEFNLTTGFRSSVFRPLVSVWFFLPLVFLGFQPLDILFMDALCQIYGIVVHTRFVRRMPAWFEWIWVSPSHHRVHHGSNVLYLDKNMGMVLIIWDRMFGTFQAELDSEPVVYGLTKNPKRPHHPLYIIFHEWGQLFRDISRKGNRLADRLKYIFYPPGWSADGSTKTAKEMRREQSEGVKHDRVSSPE